MTSDIGQLRFLNANLMIFSKLGVDHLTLEVVVVGLVWTRRDCFQENLSLYKDFFLGTWVGMIFFYMLHVLFYD